MKFTIKFASVLILALAAPLALHAAGIDGKWKAEFDTQVGVQKYVYEFKTDSAGKVTGKATWDRMEQKGETELKDIKVTGNDIAFVEPIAVPDMEIKLAYAGKMNGDEIQFTRTIGEFGSETLVAKRVAAEAAAAAKPAAEKAAPEKTAEKAK